MKVAQFTGLRELEIVEAPEPKPERPDDVLLRIDRVGVCGSDVHYYVRGGIGDQVIEYPATLGHECSATVMEVGTAVEGLQPGTRVAVDPAIVCGECDQCRAGRLNTCRNLRFMGCPNEAPGAVAEYSVMPAENCFPLHDAITLDQAVLIEPLSVGLYAVQLGQLRPKTRIGIFGAGPIGLSVLLCAKVTAPCKVYMTDLLDPRLEVARRCGADWTGNAETEDVTAAMARQEPLGLEVVFECSGDPACVDQAQQLLAPGGTLVMVGIPPTRQVSFDVHIMRRQEYTFKNVRRQKGCVAPAIRMVGEGLIDLEPLLTHRFPLQRIRDAFELVADYADGVIKAVVDVSSVR